MKEKSELIIGLIKRIWNKQEKGEWKGSWPEWRWGGGQSISEWLEWRRNAEGAEGLWRIHDKLYDLSEWTNNHPGGPTWISTTRGTDITEAFECHHIKGTAEALLPKFYKRDAKVPRNCPFTFKVDGFFRTLKREVKLHLDSKTTNSKHIRSKLFTDSLLAISIALAVAGACYVSYISCVLAGIVLCLLTICGHNYFHQKDNFRMYYFNLSLLSYRDWRISHGMSHHLYPNSRYDLEISMLTPFLQWLPRDNKTLFARYMSWLYSPIAYLLIFHKQWIERVSKNPDGWAELIPLVYPAAMIFMGGATPIQAIALWQLMILSASFTFGVIGVNAAHHHPEIFHDGDYAREDKDWGLYQLDAVRDRLEVKGSLPLVMVLFGDHSLHHMFPTLDHSDLDQLYPIFFNVCKRFGYDFAFSNQIELMKGQFQQLARTESRKNYKTLNTSK